MLNDVFLSLGSDMPGPAAHFRYGEPFSGWHHKLNNAGRTATVLVSSFRRRPLNETPSGSTADILIHQRYSWRRSYWSVGYQCDDTMIAAKGYIGVGTGTLNCFSTGTCGSSSLESADVICTDYSATAMDYSSGERYDTLTLPLGGVFVVGFYNGNWLTLAIGGGGYWLETNKIDLTVRPDGIINTSPITSTLPVIYRTINVQHVHVVQMFDANSGDTLRCRWATNNIPANSNNCDECASVCAPTLPSYNLFPDNCTLVFTITTLDYYAVALQIEDFYTPTSPTPMSSVPIQFLFYGVSTPTGCSANPMIIGNLPNLACHGTPIGNLTTETVVAQIGCSGKTIVEFTTSSPIGLIKTAIANPSAGIFTMDLLFIPTADQYGPQVFCAAAVDNTNVQSDPWCITFLVGFTSPNLQTPLLVQGSASPVGTVFSNQTTFSIQSKNGINVNRPSHNGTYVAFHDANTNGSIVLSYDCGYSTNVNYIGDTIVVNAPFAWVPGHQYYVTFDQGASSGNDFCHAESDAITDPTFWRFDIWNPALSSTTTTTTTPPTTHTVTTRAPSTTTPIANLTTTGIVLTSPTTVTTTTTTSTTATTVTTTTTESITPATTLQPDAAVMTPKQLEEACKQPVAVGTVLTMVGTIPLHIIGMFVIFTKIEKMFNPHQLMANQRRQAFANRIGNKH